jgi:hypothetical protein
MTTTSPFQGEVRQLLFKAWLYSPFIRRVEALFTQVDPGVWVAENTGEILEIANDLCVVRRMLESNLLGAGARLEKLGFFGGRLAFGRASPTPVPPS